MIVRAAMMFFRTDKNVWVTIPCHRHHDGYQILRSLDIPYDKQKTIQGFLDEYEHFYTRQEAYIEASYRGQINPNTTYHATDLFSEDLW